MKKKDTHTHTHTHTKTKTHKTHTHTNKTRRMGISSKYINISIKLIELIEIQERLLLFIGLCRGLMTSST